ncbi:gem-associated protein 7 [Denticeps clupeoides]|uniref:Gem-associated protein 7 n=1 Tax=Denticeps clupeoides TaxID=299321 RepID=A0AAY4C7H4_9TELE|nr:gem-associated protein 7 [Denticeps clupeoides]XP_028817549.1 gem-associated protein 7 [Denticeps clupeoides]
MKTVAVLRLPRGPEPNSRGFDPTSPRYAALCPAAEGEQRARSELRERFLRTLAAAAHKAARFTMYERVQVQARFGASDVDVLNFHVADLQTPIGVQRDALLRAQDVISFSFDL